MKKLLVLGGLAMILCLAPSVEARGWCGPQDHRSYNAYEPCGPTPGGYHNPYWGQPRPPRGHADYHGGWHQQPVGWRYNHPDRRWQHPHGGRQQSYFFR